MHDIMAKLVKGIQLSGDVRDDMVTFLRHHGLPKTAAHSMRVAAEAKRLAIKVGADALLAERAGWLHDISAVWPSHQRSQIAKALGVTLLPEEEIAPMIIHQKLSVVIARDIFQVTNEAVLSAIGCHTTLKANASLLDKVVFVADKIKWDQPGTPPYLEALVAALDNSLDQAAFCYLDYLWQRRESLQVVHPWLVEAYQQHTNPLTHLSYGGIDHAS